MNSKKSNAATRAKFKYNRQNYDYLYPTVPKGRKAVYEQAADELKISLNEFIRQALEEKTEKVLGEK